MIPQTGGAPFRFLVSSLTMIPMILFGSSAAAAIVKLRCPRCGCVQARARGAENAEYTCRACHAPFTRAAGTIDETTPRLAKER